MLSPTLDLNKSHSELFCPAPSHRSISHINRNDAGKMLCVDAGGELYIENRVSDFGTWESAQIELNVNDSTSFESRFLNDEFLIVAFTPKLNFISVVFVKVRLLFLIELSTKLFSRVAIVKIVKRGP